MLTGNALHVIVIVTAVIRGLALLAVVICYIKEKKQVEPNVNR